MEFICPVCDRECASQAGLVAHLRSHEESSPSRASGNAPAKIKGWVQNPVLKHGQRTIKMLRPICGVCQNERPRRKNWQKTCPHEPFVTMVPRFSIRRTYRDELDNNGAPTGNRIVTETQEVEAYEPVPNRVQPSLSMKISSGQSYFRGKFRKGYLELEDLGRVVPSEHFPNGIARACEFRDCWNQNDLMEYFIEVEEDEDSGQAGGNFPVGVFCRRREAALVAKIEYNEATGGAVDIDTGIGAGRRLRAQQLASIQMTSKAVA